MADAPISGHFLWDGNQTPPEGTRFRPFVRVEAADGNLPLGLPFGGIGRPDPLTVPVVIEVAAKRGAVRPVSCHRIRSAGKKTTAPTFATFH